MSYFFDKIASLADKFRLKIPSLDIPWDKLGEMMSRVNPYLADANQIFPVDAILTCLGIWCVLQVVLLTIWVFKFLRDLLPF